MDVLMSVCGLFGFMGFAWLCSTSRKHINWRVIVWGLMLQFAFGVFIFLVPMGSKVFLLLNEVVVRILGCAAQGSQFVFGSLALPPGAEGSPGFIFAFQALPTIIFFSALLSILYYYNVMPLVVRLFARIFSTLMRISGAEALAASSNIFVGVESAFTVRPHIQKMTHSELCLLLTAGMATVASNVLALYVFTLQDVFPTIAGHLVSASILSAPAAIIMAKLIWPETGKPETLGVNIQPHYEKPDNIFLAVIHGAEDGVKVILSITALLVAVLGLAALVDMVLGLISSDLSLKLLLTYMVYPLTWMLGVAQPDVHLAAGLIGEKLILTEVVAYQDLAKLLAENSFSDPRSAVIIAYALCGFTHIASVAIFVGAVTAIAPEKAKEISQVSFRALIAATLACLMTGAIAGIFYRGGGLLLH